MGGDSAAEEWNQHKDMAKKMKYLSFRKEAWSAIPTTVFTLAGVAVSVLYHNESRTLTTQMTGVLLIAVGLLLDLWVRSILTEKAKFPDWMSTKRLVIVDQHKLVTDGLFGHVRHPLYLGRISMMFGIALFFSSLWGAVLMAIAALCFLISIRIEEEMLIGEFSNAYHEYRKKAKMVIPYVY